MHAPDEAQLRTRFDALRTARTAAAPPLPGLLHAARARRRAAAAGARRRRLFALALAVPLGGALTAYALERSADQTLIRSSSPPPAHWLHGVHPRLAGRSEPRLAEHRRNSSDSIRRKRRWRATSRSFSTTVS
jgi:hypothetical protein